MMYESIADFKKTLQVLYIETEIPGMDPNKQQNCSEP